MEITKEVKESQLGALLRESNLEKTKSDALLSQFDSYVTLAEEWKIKAEALVITSPSQVSEMKQAKEARLLLRDKRIAIDKKHKELKEGSLREGQALDSIKRFLVNLIEPIEKSLKEKEDFAEIFEANRRLKLATARIEELAPYGIFSDNGYSVGDMDDFVWKAFFERVKSDFAEKEEKEKQEEEERQSLIELQRTFNERMLHVAKYNDFYTPGTDYAPLDYYTTEAQYEVIIKTCQERKSEYDTQQERIAQENIKLKSEAKERQAIIDEHNAMEAANLAEMEAIARMDREKAELEARQLQFQFAEKEAILNKKIEDERIAKEAEALRLHKESTAPDRDKLFAYADAIRAIVMQDMTSQDGIILAMQIIEKNTNHAMWVEKLARSL